MIDIIKERLRQYGAGNALEEDNAVKEILQEIALYALSCIDCAAFPKTPTSCYGFLIPHSTGRRT